MNINWYPGHMKKTRESIQKSLTMVDIVFELIDARIPASSQNPVIDSIVGEKPRVIILNKSDLANSHGNKIWQEYFLKKNISSVCLDALSGKGIDRLLEISYSLTDEKRKAYEKRGVISRPTRAMILGIPNVGKSTLINSLSGRKGAKTGNKPGVTKSNQWIKTKGNLELLDTPGILWPKFEDPDVGLNLAFTGAIKDEILDIETLALRLVERLANYFPNLLNNRYNIEIEGKSYLEIMEEIGRRRGCIIKGGEIDYTKVSNIVLDEFRKGVIGNITLEFPKE
ncbi:ribosome biogenesis GTPase YlqF [Tissierella sp. P1]|jgi:ribosome biogenesis GTPase A|uniref:ribosome biogenesis GTPase YlqF n=1 Tax=Tissierella sp. P1 TaxID=1280483 RepID=UPI000BA10769|nr:ribosome biogenesis GTPase YlqF [Tissierella sp. P1]MDU5079862.1 ribosome biogenesis GTPase YlqF [Bacillota bacterium]OZV12888.1 ribosome biogenesis GTPase YlqF [Tissierella sp. P1]